MCEDLKSYPLRLIEAELAIIIVLLSVFLFTYYVDNKAAEEDHELNDKCYENSDSIES